VGNEIEKTCREPGAVGRVAPCAPRLQRAGAVFPRRRLPEPLRLKTFLKLPPDSRSRITHHASRITHHASRITHHASRITHHATRITHHASRITHHASRITHHASRITHHASRITHHA